LLAEQMVSTDMWMDWHRHRQSYLFISCTFKSCHC